MRSRRRLRKSTSTAGSKLAPGDSRSTVNGETIGPGWSRLTNSVNERHHGQDKEIDQETRDDHQTAGQKVGSDEKTCQEDFTGPTDGHRRRKALHALSRGL